jgi:hypothetical protein
MSISEGGTGTVDGGTGHAAGDVTFNVNETKFEILSAGGGRIGGMVLAITRTEPEYVPGTVMRLGPPDTPGTEGPTKNVPMGPV